MSQVRYPLNIYAAGGQARAKAVVRRADGGFVSVGEITDSLRRYGTLLMIGDSTGRLRVRRTHKPSYTIGTYQHKLLLLPDDGFLMLTSEYQPNFHVVPYVSRFDALGNLLWERTYAGWYHDISNVVPRLDGSYTLIGTKGRQVGGARGPFAQDVWIGGITAWGDTLPARRYARLRGNDNPAFALDAALMPDGGLVLAGLTRPLTVPAGTGYPRNSGYLLRLDTAGRVLAQQTVTSPVPHRSYHACELPGLSVLADGRVLAAGPYLRDPNDRINGYDAAVFTFDGTTLGVLSQQLYPNAPQGFTGSTNMRVVHDPDGSLSLLGFRERRQPAPSPNYDLGIGLLRLTGLPAPYQPPYCQTPPVAYFAAALGSQADILRVLEASTGGPRYGQVLLWRWAWGDGSTSDGPRPGPHAYAAVPAPGTPVRLTVTNNLGCTATHTAYPWGRPSATQASQALAARALLWPNPTAATATLEVPEAPAGTTTVQVLNALGQVVQAHVLRPQAGALRMVLEVSALPSGVYAVRVSTAAGSFVKRLVRE